MRKRRLSVFDENIAAEKADLVMQIANLKAKLDLLNYRQPKIEGHTNVRRISHRCEGRRHSCLKPDRQAVQIARRSS